MSDNNEVGEIEQALANGEQWFHGVELRVLSWFAARQLTAFLNEGRVVWGAFLAVVTLKAAAGLNFLR